MQRPIEEGRNKLLEKTVVSQGLGRTFSLFTVQKTLENHHKIFLQKFEREKEIVDLL